MKPEIAVEGDAALDRECSNVLEAVHDRRTNGGSTKQIREAALKLLSKLCHTLEKSEN